MPTIYLISGLGADRRVFRKLIFPEGLEPVYLDWIPARKKETLKQYAARLAERIDSSVPFYLAGLSFGGMLATEIALKLRPVHTFLISSVCSYKELPWYYRLAGRIHLHQMLPVGLVRKTNRFELRFLGANTGEEKQLLRQLVADSDPQFMKWAINCILNWRNTTCPPNTTRLHGAADHILPLRYCRPPDHIFAHAGHFMVYADAEALSKVIASKIEPI